jgi:hypothetical protein
MLLDGTKSWAFVSELSLEITTTELRGMHVGFEKLGFTEPANKLELIFKSRNAAFSYTNWK